MSPESINIDARIKPWTRFLATRGGDIFMLNSLEAKMAEKDLITSYQQPVSSYQAIDNFWVQLLARLPLAAGIAASASVGLAAEPARAAIKGEKTPIEIADKYYGTHVSDPGYYEDKLAKAVLSPSLHRDYEEGWDAILDWTRKNLFD